jgi:hypothetical protein
VIEAAKRLRHHQQFSLGETEHVAKLVFAEDRHQGIDDGADPEGGQRDDSEFPPIGQLHRDDVATADAEALQSGSCARNEIAEFGVGEAPRLAAIRTVAQQRELSRSDRDGRLQKFVEVLVDPEAAGAHRSRVGCGIESIFAHAFPP